MLFYYDPTYWLMLLPVRDSRGPRGVEYPALYIQ